MTVDPEIPVPPQHYGGIERIVGMLIADLAARGHDIHLFAHPDSQTPATLIPYRHLSSRSLWDTARNAQDIADGVQQLGSVDVIHSFGRLAYLLPLLRTCIPKIQSYQRHITPRSVWLGCRLAGSTLTFTACSEFCAAQVRHLGGRWTVIPNGVPLDTYHFSPCVSRDAPLIFLGRIERIKGAHTAIAVAQRANRRLILAGTRADQGPDHEYFTREILPHCDGHTIQYVGPVTDAQKSDLLGQAAALLFPIEWEEPFGIVMVEALACGTPIVAFSRGAVPEVVQHELTGFLCHSTDELVQAVGHLDFISRDRCRRVVEERFSSRVITNAYEHLYEQSCSRVG